MRSKVKSYVVLFLLGFCVCSVIPSAHVRAAENSESTAEAIEEVAQGWQKTTAGKKQYYENGTAVTGLKKIGSRWYFFDNKGNMRTGTVQCDGWIYYLNSKGVLEVRQKGTKTYYYSKKARLVKSKGEGAVYYYANGKKMNKVDAADTDVTLKAQVIVDGVTTSKMSKAKKLKKCFSWVMEKNYKTWRKFSPKKGWPATYANDHFTKGLGECHADGAAFAYLAKALGYKKVYVCNDCDGSRGRGHSWAEVDGKAYDPLFAQAKSYKRNYGVSAKSYTLRPVLHVKLDSRMSAGTVTSVKKVSFAKEDTGSTVQKPAEKQAGWDSTKTYYYDKKTGRKLKGTHVIGDKFYVFGSTGKYSKTKTAKLRKAAKYQKSFSGVEKILGKPKKIKWYGSSCFAYKGEGGEDGVAVYKNFRVSLFRTSKTKKIIYMGVE